MVGLGVALSLGVHVLLFWTSPPVRISTLAGTFRALEVVELPAPPELPPELEFPDRPETVRRPAPPVVRTPSTALLSDEPAFIPHDVPPRLMNPAEVESFLLGFYPPSLKAIGVEGEVTLWLYLSEEGYVIKTQVRRSSGFGPFDELAQTVAGLMKFRPALNHGEPTPVWVAQPIRFGVELQPVQTMEMSEGDQVTSRGGRSGLR